MNLLQDLRFGIRMFFKNPGFTAIAVLTLALGIGANTAIFSIVYGMMLKPLEYKDPDRLVYLWSANPAEGWDQSDISLPNFIDWRAQAKSFENMGIYHDLSHNLTGGDHPEVITAVRSTASLLSTLGVEPALGRMFTVDEETKGKHHVALLFHEFWQRNFGGDPDVVGSTLLVDENDITVIGVLPPNMEKAWGRDDLWMPLGLDVEEISRGSGRFEAIARLADGVTHEQAQTEMANIATRLAEVYPEFNRGRTVNVMPLMEDILGEQGTLALYILMAAVFFVLLIACANMANLLLVRGTVRQKEVAIRTAMGAGRFRLVCQMITECLILALAGGMLGTVFAHWGIDALLAMMPDDVPRKDEIVIDRTVMLFTIILSLSSAFIFGLLPALSTSNINLVQSIKDGAQKSSDGGGRHVWRDVLVVGQIAMALALVIGAGLMIRSFTKLRRVDPGFNTHNLLTMRVSLPSYRYENLQQRTQFFEDVRLRMFALVGVEGVGAVSSMPLGGSNSWSNAFIEGYDNPDPNRDILLGRKVVTAGYFATMQIPLLRGRDFTSMDDEDNEQVVIVNRELAEKYWPDQEAVGQRLKWGKAESDNPWKRVIGVSENVKHRGLDADVRVEVYETNTQVGRSGMFIVARTEADPTTVITAVKQAVWDVDSDQAIYAIRTMDEIIFEDIGAWQAFGNVLSTLASVAMFLAAIGLYGLMSFTISRRTQEIGIRMALGAMNGDVLWLVLRKSVILTMIGILLGGGLGVGMGVALSAIMYDMSPVDPMTYLSVAFLLVFVSLIATYIPARRALAIDPMTALRYE